MKVGIIRCEARTHECAGYKCFPAAQHATGMFTGYTNVEIVGFDTCGGCGRKKADKIVDRALRLQRKGAEVIHLSDCVLSGCLHLDIYLAGLRAQGLKVVEGTHKLPAKQ